MRTGRYRVRRGHFGVSVLQAEYDSPSLIAGHVDASIRRRSWHDVKFEDVSHIVFKEKDDKERRR